MFLHMCVILFMGGSPGRPPQAGSPPWQGEPPPPGTRQTPPDQADTPPGPGRHPPGPGRPPQDQADPPPGTWQTPPQEADCSIWSMSSQYASYWNAFLLTIELQYQCVVIPGENFSQAQFSVWDFSIESQTWGSLKTHYKYTLEYTLMCICFH